MDKNFYAYFYGMKPGEICPVESGYEDFRTRKPSRAYRKQPYYILHTVLDGKGTYCLGNRSFSVSKDMAFLCLPNERLCYYPSLDFPYRYIWVAFTGSKALHLCDRVGLTYESPVVPLHNEEMRAKLRPYTELLFQDTSLADENTALSLLYFLLACIGSKRQPEKFKSFREQAVEKALEYMEQNFSEAEMSIEDIAAYLHISHVYLCKIFQEIKGYSAKSCLCEIRLQKARLLLESRRYTVTEVMERSGYRSLPHFSKSFRRRFGVSPGMYTKNSTPS